MNILGLNAFHGDSSAALVQDGVVVAAAEEERFRRLKHWAGFKMEPVLQKRLTPSTKCTSFLIRP
jgi:carbamoyltransferase